MTSVQVFFFFFFFSFHFFDSSQIPYTNLPLTPEPDMESACGQTQLNKTITKKTK